MGNEAGRGIHGHDTIVIGASEGGLEALQTLVRTFSADLPAAVFIVMHIGIRSHLTEILGKKSALPVLSAESGAPVRTGTITVAPPGKHLLIHDGHMLLRRGPRENMARPAIDPLFRTAAASRGGRVIGVVLSGNLNDGTAGLRAIKRCGGLAVVQDPEDAAVPAMVRSALRHVDVDHVQPIDGMGDLLSELARKPAPPTPEIPLEIRVESTIAAQELATMELEEELGELSPFSCPECNGVLWEVNDGSMLRYRCHVGHAFTAETVLSARAAEVDRMLESLLRSHQERAALVRRMAQHERSLQNDSLAAQLEARAEEYEHDAEVVRRLARHGRPTEGDEGEFLRNEAAEEQET
ncbi:chemotaxis protein CheB [Dongia sp.]|uniref:chemotaxis protein CheB n=1 Tax=Dongia sp. TaxID=1977262 RepID=UPI0037533FD2